MCENVEMVEMLKGDFRQANQQSDERNRGQRQHHVFCQRQLKIKVGTNMGVMNRSATIAAVQSTSWGAMALRRREELHHTNVAQLFWRHDRELFGRGDVRRNLFLRRPHTPKRHGNRSGSAVDCGTSYSMAAPRFPIRAIRAHATHGHSQVAGAARKTPCTERMASMRVVAGCARALRNPKSLVSRNSPLLSGKPLSVPGGAGQQVRRLNVHEYVSMEIMAAHDIDIPTSKMAETPEDAEKACAEIMGGDAMKDVVIKAQVLSGGRGRGHFDNGFQSGVHMCLKPADAKHYASEMLGQKLITKQTGEDGLPCDKVLLMERMYMRREMYLSIMMDRGSQGPVIVACPDGGTSIEDLAESNPELILKEEVDIMAGLTDAQAGKIAEHLKLSPDGPSYEAGKTLLKNMYAMFIERDCTLVEINPLAETPEGRVMACDAKLNFDDNAEWRQKETFKFRDYTQEDTREVEAAKYDLNYIGLSGNIGCMVNGAGLAMSTMDIIKLKGGDPANFLDVGGGATEEQVEKAFELLNADPKVDTILVNIFGGIMRCDVIATGVINAAKSIGMKKPIVIRLQGTNVEQANDLIANCGFKMIISNDLEDAAEKAVAVAEIYSQASKVGIDVELQTAST